jgi:hypothetical protein
MQLNTASPQLFKDFTPDYIQALARSQSMTYTASTTSADRESGVYNNVKTNTIELHKLDMIVDNLACEYYTASFVPILVSEMQGRVSEIRSYVQIFAITLPYEVEPVYVESRTNVTINNMLGLSSVMFKDEKLVELEGDFNNYFRVHVPSGGEINAFTILAPNVMMRLLEDAGDFDFEFSKNKIYFYMTFPYTRPDAIPLAKKQFDDLLKFGIESARAMARAARPTKQLSGSSTAMWEIYGGSRKKVGFIIGLVMGGIFFIMLCLIIPLLWPLLIPIWLFGRRRYRQLIAKKRQLIKRWKEGEDMKVMAS